MLGRKQPLRKRPHRRRPDDDGGARGAFRTALRTVAAIRVTDSGAHQMTGMPVLMERASKANHVDAQTN